MEQSPLRCQKCNKLLAAHIDGAYVIHCPRCKYANISVKAGDVVEVTHSGPSAIELCYKP